MIATAANTSSLHGAVIVRNLMVRFVNKEKTAKSLGYIPKLYVMHCTDYIQHNRETFYCGLGPDMFRKNRVSGF